MASKSTLSYLSIEVDGKLQAVRTRLNYLAAGTPESDRAADLLRQLSITLDEVSQQATDIRNAAVAHRS